MIPTKLKYYLFIIIDSIYLVCVLCEANPLQYSCLENPMDRGAWQATVHEVAKSWTRLRDFHFTSK